MQINFSTHLSLMEPPVGVDHQNIPRIQGHLGRNHIKQEEHQLCIWMKRQMEAAVMLAWVWFGVAIGFTCHSFVWSKKKYLFWIFEGPEAV